jgi:hypothetical protein
MLKIMKAFEFGQNDADERKPWVAMVTSGALFFTGTTHSLSCMRRAAHLKRCVRSGALPTLVPFACTDEQRAALIACGVLCAAALFFGERQAPTVPSLLAC